MLSIAENQAVKTLLRSHIHTLPVSFDKVKKLLLNDGWQIVRYDVSSNVNEKKLRSLNVWDVAVHRNGFALCNDSVKIIFINARLSVAERLLVLTHEFAHVKLQHFSSSGVLGYHPENEALSSAQENEANDFVLAFLAPACILKMAHITTSEQIAKITLLDNAHAERAAGVIQSNSGALTIEERALCKQFRKYIHLQTRRQTMAKYIAVCAALSCICIALMSYFHSNVNTAFTQVPASVTSSPTPSAQSGLVVVTPAGTKFHKPSCRHAKNENARTLTLDQAQREGYGACQVCHPLD